jgi:two-component system C4-dicarboxylate transport response regulator DctD
MTGKPMPSDVIVIDDEHHIRTACEQALELEGISAECHERADAAISGISRDYPGVIVCDVKMPGMDGLAFLKAVLELDPELPVILMTGHGDVPMAVSAMRDGAYDFIEKPFSSEMLVGAVRRAREKRELVMSNRSLMAALDSVDPLERRIVGQDASVVALRRQIAGFAVTDADVLIEGETGTGKELVARSLHELSPRAGQRFVPVNCGALPESIIESELFGHEEGAFTGASRSRVGKFEYADGGTLFLDEIESMPVDLQSRLLRVLQDRSIVRLGSNTERKVDVRVIAATNEDLLAMADRREFRADLYYRLNVLSLKLPPLRRRKADIPILFHHFVRLAAARFKVSAPVLTPADLARITAHDWPGNVRELENVAMRFTLGLGITSDEAEDSPLSGDGNDGGTLSDMVAGFEKQVIARTLAANDGSIKQTYEQLGLARKTLYDKMRKYGLGGTDQPD